LNSFGSVSTKISNNSATKPFPKIVYVLFLNEFINNCKYFNVEIKPSYIIYFYFYITL